MLIRVPVVALAVVDAELGIGPHLVGDGGAHAPVEAPTKDSQPYGRPTTDNIIMDASEARRETSDPAAGDRTAGQSRDKSRSPYKANVSNIFLELPEPMISYVVFV